MKAVQDQAAKGDKQAQNTLELIQFAQKPRIDITGSETFKKVFDPGSKNAASRFITGATKNIEGMTSLENIYSLSSIYAMPESIAKPMGLRFQADLATSGVQGVADATQKSAGDGKEGDAAEAWGGLFGNLVVIAGMHYGEKGIHAGVDAVKNRDTTALLNDRVQSEYKKKFNDLDDNQKAGVLYSSLEEESPKFKKRVDQEVDRLNQKRGVGKGRDEILSRAAGGVDLVEPTSEEVKQQRVDAAKKLVRQIVERKTREEAYKQAAHKREQEARQAEAAAAESSRIQGEKDRAADQARSLEEQRGFGVSEGRVAESLKNRGVNMTTEREPGRRYDPEPTQTGIPVIDRRAAANEPTPEEATKVTAAEARVNEISEQQTGTSFSSKSVAEQRNAASWLEQKHPEAWEAFKATPAHAQYLSDVKNADMADSTIKGFLERNPSGEAETLHPGADLNMGIAQLVLNRINVDSVFKSDPATHRELNEHAEKNSGKSFDSQDEGGKVSALAAYLRDKPTKVLAFMTPDLTERMKSGQHIDLANMDAESRAKVQAQTLMASRDDIRRTMDTSIADQLIAEEKKKHQQELTDTMYASLAGRSPSLEAVYATSRDMTERASKLGLGQVNTIEDLFKIEKDAQSLPARLRTPATNEFLTKMRQVRAAAEDHVLRELAESTAAKFRVDKEEARASSAKQVIHFSAQAEDLQRSADELRAQGRKADADSAQAIADFNHRKADAIVAGAENVTNPPPAPQPKANIPMSVGRETRVVTPGNSEGLPAHYVLMEATDAQTSHLPGTFEKRPGYDQNGQPRDYSVNTAAQGGVESRAANLDLDILLSNDPQTMGGPSVVDQKAHVISGNGRMLSMLTALRNKPGEFFRYVKELGNRAVSFGVDPAEIVKFKNPVLVKMLDTPIDSSLEWARLGSEMNRDPTLGLSESEQGVAMARLLSPDYSDRLGKIVDSLPTFDKEGRALTVREAMRSRSTDIAKLMSDAGIISPNKTAEFLTEDGELKEKAKAIFENMLAGLTVTDSAVLERSSDAIKDKLARAGLFFIQMRNAGENWNLASMNTDAVRLMTRAQEQRAYLDKFEFLSKPGDKAGAGESVIERMLHPERFRLSNYELGFDGQPLHAPVHPGVEALAMALEESPRAYSTLIAKYADRAQDGGSTMFGAEHPADVFTSAIASKYGLSTIPEEWGSVVGLPDAVKAEIEMSRGPLPVEPEVHAETAISDVTPDSSSITSAIPDGPRTVQELRKTLENHPNVSPEEAEALTDIFESILPRAIGTSFDDLLGNRRLNFAIGGKEGNNRGYMEMVEDGKAIIRLCDSADASSFLHEMAHYIKNFLNPGDQTVANGFVGAKPGEEWSTEQEEKFAQAFERYHHDGGIRRGKLEKVFATISRAMQSIYNAVTSKKLAAGTKELNAMFDNWYDWNRSERKPITARLDPDAIAAAARGEVEIPKNAKTLDYHGREISGKAQNFVFVNKESADDFVRDKKNGVKAWRSYKVPGEDTVYVKAETKKGKKLYQPSLNESIDLARKAKELEAQLKRTQDPREQARLRGILNGVEDKLRGSTFVVGGKAEPKDTSAVQLVHGVSEKPTINEPTTPEQAVTVQQAHGDPTAVSLGGERGKPGRVSDGPATDGPKEADRVPERGGAADGEHGTAKGGRGAIAKPAKSPLADVNAAKLKAPEKPRGTPVTDPDTWRGHVEALGLPTGTPPPTVRLSSDVRQLMIYPGQAEAIEGALSALQQYDGTILAAPTGSGKSHMLSAIAENLLGTGGDKVGLLVTRSQNLIHEADGFVDTARKYGVDVDGLPAHMAELQTGMYAATYAQLRGNRDVLTVPWDFVLFDEAAEARNWTDSEQGKAVVLLGHAAKKVVYSSATPHSTVMELGYMHKLELWPKGGFTEWAGQFGLREIGPNTYSGGTSARKLEKLRQQLIERGQWQTLHKDMDGVEAHVALVPQTPEVRQGVRNIRTAFAMAMDGFKRSGMSRYLTPTAGHEAIYLKRFIEGARLPEAIDLAKKAIADGWKPIIFSEYRSGAEEGMDFFHNLPGGLGEQINKLLPPLPNVVDAMRAAFGDKVGIFAGEANELRAEELNQFMSGDKDALYMTYSAGGVGVNPQDKVGDKPRMGVFLGLPWSGIMFEQSTGRPWRYGTKSNVANVFLTSDTLPEMKVLATKILPRMRALKAAVYGERVESKLSKNLRESVGIPEEMLQYEQGEEVRPQAAEWEQDGEGATYTHLADFDMPKAKDAKNKGMKYKGQGKKLYQGPKDEDPWQQAANDAWADLMKRTDKLPAPAARAITANEGVIKIEAAQAGRRAMGSGESVKSATERKTRDMENEALIWLDDMKDNGRAASHFLKSSLWMFGTSGDRAVESIFRNAKMPEQGAELKRRMIDYDIRSGNYRGEFGGMVAKIIDEYRLKPAEHELVTKVIEGKGHSDDPRINKAADAYRSFFATVRKRLADSGLAVVIYEGGKRKEVPFSKIENDPNYWPRMYDWNKKFTVKGENGKPTVTSLGDIMKMPKGSERREALIEQVAKQRGVSKLQAQAFFDKGNSGIRLAGNIERAREFDIPMYGRDRQSIERYVNEVAEKLAAAEVHGQFRQKTDPLIDSLPTERERKLVNHIVTADLDPARLHDSDRLFLRRVNRWLVISKMSLSALKLPFHLAKTSLATNTRSVARAMIQGITSPMELKRNAVDSGTMVNYIKQAWMREYGMKTGGIDQKMLDFNGFTAVMNFSRVIAAGAGRLWMEKYAYPELVKNPKDAMLRRKMGDLYGFTEEQLDNMIANGYGPNDVKRVELGAANWTTGSGRPSELPPALRGTTGQPVYDRLTTLLRISQSLHGFMFKTANLVNRTVWQELYRADYKSPAPYQLIARFGANFGIAGWALSEILHLRHQMSGSSEADIEKRRREWLTEHPLSKEALFTVMSDISMGMGAEVLTQFFNELATHDPKDKQKLTQQNRVINAATDLFVGVAARDAYNVVTATKHYWDTFYDTGAHKETPEQRRAKIAEQLANEEVPLSRYAFKPSHAEPVHHGRRRRAASALR